MNNVFLSPLYKWTGGKRKEIKTFSDYYPDFVKNGNDYKFVEPFFGGGAVYWSLNANENVINDIDFDLINFIKNCKTNSKEIIEKIKELGDKLSEITKEEKLKKISISEGKTKRGEYFYQYRNLDRNNGLSNLTDFERAIRFYVVNQLAFNGMRRFNSKGEFNVPYGNYKTINITLTNDHVNLLNKTTIFNGQYSKVILENDTENTFIYLDPPYTREFNEYSHENVFGKKEQLELCEIFKGIKNAKAMIIINKDDFTTSLYEGFIKATYELKYSTNIKNRFDNSVEHLIITNY